jgi:type IV secretory pathway VirB4 component
LLGPPGVELDHDHLRLDRTWQRTFAVIGYPREVSRGWLAPLLRAAGELDLVLHVEPIPPAVAADRLHRQRARLESTRRLEAERGQLSDPTVAAAAEDVHELASRLARGESRLFRSGVYLSVRASSREELEERSERVRALCASLLLHVVPATFRPLDGWVSTLPLGVDRLRLRRAFDTEALAAGFPFAATDPPLEDGVLYGVTDSGAPVFVDRFGRENFNSVLLSRSGAGKSYLAKVEALRLLFRGVQVFVIDPEDEYRRLCEAVGGAYLPLTGPEPAAFNPLDLPAGGGTRVLDERILFLAELIELLAGDVAGGELAALDRAARTCYAHAGITDDPASHRRAAPLLRDLVRALEDDDGGTATALAERLSPYATGSHSSLFDRPTSARPDAPLVCFSLRDLPERLKAPALLLCLDAIWRSLAGPLRRRCVVVDEAWLLMREPAGARFLFRLAKSARKRWCALTAITQDAADLLGTDLGQAVVSNAATQLLLRQAPQAIERVGEAFRLSAGERRYLLACPTGHGLLLSGDQRVPLRVVASKEEHGLVTTDPAEVAALEAAA